MAEDESKVAHRFVDVLKILVLEDVADQKGILQDDHSAWIEWNRKLELRRTGYLVQVLSVRYLIVLVNLGDNVVDVLAERVPFTVVKLHKLGVKQASSNERDHRDHQDLFDQPAAQLTRWKWALKSSSTLSFWKQPPANLWDPSRCSLNMWPWDSLRADRWRQWSDCKQIASSCGTARWQILRPVPA